MSTSPSWFDQEKFSRLVKKVGPKTVTEQLPSVSGTDPDNRGEGLASTARISLVSKPPSLLAEQRALPALPRRTAPLPSIKALFPVPHAPAPAQVEPVKETPPPVAEEKPEESSVATEEESSTEFGPDGEALEETWQKMGLLNEELARAIHDRDQAITEGQILREQLRKAEIDLSKKASEPAAPSANVERLTKERDEAIAQVQTLRAEAIKKLDAAKDLRSATQSGELTLLTEERDQARKQYASIRKQYEDLKKDQPAKDETRSLRMNSDKLVADLRSKIADQEQVIDQLKTSSASASESSEGDENLKIEAASLREQMAKMKDELSIAQRGLALSQKALHETRDTLREATEGTSLSRHNFDNLKNECAILTQQNTVLQAQNDQLTKDLAATKSKLTTRL